MSDTADLPSNFKTTLPPRKRAKTKEEKEQRRVERILRNRKAAHASREKKRKHVEFLESYVLDVEKQLSLVSKLNASLLKNFYPGGNAEIDGLVDSVNALPDLKQVKMEHNIELDDDKSPVPSCTLPKTPESFTSGSPKSSGEEEEEIPQLDSRSSSFSEEPHFDLGSNTSGFMDVDSYPYNKFSLDIITGDPNLSGTTVVKQEDTSYPQQLSNLIDPFKKGEAGLLSSLDKCDLFDFQENTSDNDFEFNELRNPAVITVTDKSTDFMEYG